MAIKENDFIEVDYNGKLQEDSVVFDTTNEQVAKDSGIYQEGQKFGKVIICIGEDHILKNLEKQLIGKEPGKHTIPLKAEDAFGKKSAKMVQLISAAKFTKEGIQPQVGLQVNVDGMFGIVRSVTGGRVLVDLNHPLAGKDVVYDINVFRIITDVKEKAQGLLDLQFGQGATSSELKEDELNVTLNFDLPEDYQGKFTEKIQELIPEVKKVSYSKQASQVPASEAKTE
ncbi:peptidylprolyl isomerase [Candidatus Woesearchaeota archaeon]|jgi:FKBP-type peptidyl-prolyl cis-trans isomerase 2|nr:peptidylprolyl isomerase [Candidatus Woesearchaeota archaeon]